MARAVGGVLAEIARGIDHRGRVAGCPLNNLAQELVLGDPDFRAVLAAVFKEWRMALGARIAGTKGGQRLSSAERVAAATFIVSAYSGAMAQAKVAQRSAPLRSAAAELSRWINERSFVPPERRSRRAQPL
jgi:hypothetical protein